MWYCHSVKKRNIVVLLTTQDVPSDFITYFLSLVKRTHPALEQNTNILNISHTVFIFILLF